MKHYEIVLEKDRKLFTPWDDFHFQEHRIRIEGGLYREWQANRSKLAAAISKGVRIDLNEQSKILYLGAAHGYTVSFLSQICKKGIIYAVEFAPRVARELILLSETRSNIFPIVADANRPEEYYHLAGYADILFQDIAQQNQVEILVKNANLFLKKGGIAIIAVKSRSIDVTQKPMKIYADVRKELEASFKVFDYKNLEPMQKDHAIFVCRKS